MITYRLSPLRGDPALKDRVFQKNDALKGGRSPFQCDKRTIPGLKAWVHFTFFALLMMCTSLLQSTFPVAYQGRIHSFESYAKLWLYDLYGRYEIKRVHQKAFGLSSAEELMWTIHFEGHGPFDEAPLFYLKNKDLKKALGLPLQENYFSYRELHRALIEDKESNLRLMALLIPQAFLKSYRDPANRALAEKRELVSLSPAIWAMRKNEGIEILAAPKHSPWQHLESGILFKNNADSIVNTPLFEEALGLVVKLRLFERHLPYQENVSHLKDLPTIREKLAGTGEDLRALPQRQSENPWISLKALSLSIENFTPYPDPLFYKLQKAYLSQNRGALANLLAEGYPLLEGKVHVEAVGKSLHYPTFGQLKAETWLLSFPWMLLCLVLYGGTLLALPFKQERLSIVLLAAAFSLHTFVLALRCYVLERPPVSNMFETVVYVPWIAVLGGLLLTFFTSKKGVKMRQRPKKQRRWLLAAPAFLSILFLSFLELSQMKGSLENVQPVLDSQYWLTVHVLMVVGSYGFYALACVLGHFYLTSYLWRRGKETEGLVTLASFILQALYLGTALLIPGTILGGVWAAESWGRFWDWDPKESWAFISSCVYLIWIHAYRFQQIGRFGLAVGSVAGFLAISFTWYGVNYILGTGLHSYGFGSGGEEFYYAYLLGESLFIGGVLWGYTYRKRSIA